MGPIEKAILASNIGLNPVNDGILIRLSVPPMTEERRREMVKVVGQLAEAARVSVRNAREEIHKTFKQQEEANQLTSDDVLDAKLELQEIVDGYNGQIKDITAAKEKDIMTI
jgi:ribosome recycling factor